MQVEDIILYLRKSRKDYEFANEPIEKTLERHEKILQEFAFKSYGKKIPEDNIFREVVSGDTIADRPKMQEVLSLIEEDKYKAVLVLEIERLARGNTIDQGVIAQTFEYTNTLIITPQKIFDLSDELDKSFFEDGLYQSRKYLMYTKKILARGRLASVREGKYVASTTPFGYDKEKLKGEKGYKLVINEKEAEIVKLIFDMYINNNGPGIIANYLNSIGAISKNNVKWTPAMVRNILLSFAVNGKVTWNHRKTVSSIDNGKIVKSRPISSDSVIVKGLHVAIIDDDTWNKAQLKIKQNHKSKPSSDIKNPLSGIIKCKICNHNMIRRPYNNGYKDTLMCPISNCNISSDLEVVEKRLLSDLEKILSSYISNYKDNIEQQNKPNYELVIQNIEHDIKNCENRLKKVYELFENGVYNKDEFNLRRTDIKNEIRTKREQILNIENEIKNSKLIDYSSMIPKIQNVLNLYNEPETTIKEKNELLKSIIDECYYFKQDRGRWNKDNINKFVLEIKLKI